MTENNSSEIDLVYLYNKMIQIFKGWVVLFFKAVDFCLKKRKIILVLLLVGVGLGIYSKFTNKPDKKANILLRVNFDAVNYVYSSLDLLNGKIIDNDSVFLSRIGFNTDSLEIKMVKLMPHINLQDITNKYIDNDRNLEAILRNLELSELFDDNETLMDRTFVAEYKYHELRLYLSSYATQKTIDQVLAYINDNKFLDELKSTVVQNLEDRIASNANIVLQIDQLLETYYTNESLKTPSSEIYVVDKNFSVSNLMDTKISLQKETEDLKKELVYSKDIAVAINNPVLANEDRNFTSNKIIFYPFVLIFIYLLFSLGKYVYLYLRDMAASDKKTA